MQIPACPLLSNGGGQLFTNLNLKTHFDTCRPRPAALIYVTKKSFKALDSFANWTQKGGGIQGISIASAARAETLSDALGTRLGIISNSFQLTVT